MTPEQRYLRLILLLLVGALLVGGVALARQDSQEDNRELDNAIERIEYGGP